MNGVILLAFGVACVSCAPEDVPPRPTSDMWPRCYALRTGGWTAPPGQQVQVTHSPPPMVHLDTQRVGQDTARVDRRLAPHIPALSGAGFLPPAWVHLAPDSLELRWSSGHEGVVVRLRERGDSVQGSARTFTDHGAQAVAAVAGERIACTPVGSRG